MAERGRCPKHNVTLVVAAGEHLRIYCPKCVRAWIDGLTDDRGDEIYFTIRSASGADMVEETAEVVRAALRATLEETT